MTQSLGATTASFSIVLAVFFGGLALGARWAGRRSLVINNPLGAYAALEAATGVLGLGLYPVLTRLGAIIAGIDPGTGTGGAVLRLVIAAACLLPPTFLMGATLPFVTVGTVERDDEAGSATALIYGLNTLGACLGAGLVTFVMLPQLGILGSTVVTAAVNLAVAGISFLASRREGGDGRLAPEPAVIAQQETRSTEDRKRGLAILLSSSVGGLVATSAQVVWARYFAITLKGTAYGIGSVLVAVLIGVALGSLIAAAAHRRSQHAATVSSVFQLLTLVGLFCFAASVPVMNWLLGVIPNSGLIGLPLHLVDLAVVMVFLALPTIASGAVMPSLIAVSQASAHRAGDTLARVYSLNTAGCIVGSLLTGFILLPALGSATTLYLAYVLLAVSTAVFVVATMFERRWWAAGLIVISLGGAMLFPQVDPSRLRAREDIRSDVFTWVKNLGKSDGTVSVYEGDIATVTVTGTERRGGLSLNGLGQGSHYNVPPTIAFESTLVGTIPWLHARRLDHGLVVGLGAGGTVNVLLSLGVKQLDVAELEKGVVDAVRQLWGAANPLDDPRARLIANDARHHLLTSARQAPHSYDFITSMPAHRERSATAG